MLGRWGIRSQESRLRGEGEQTVSTPCPHLSPHLPEGGGKGAGRGMIGRADRQTYTGETSQGSVGWGRGGSQTDGQSGGGEVDQDRCGGVPGKDGQT